MAKQIKEDKNILALGEVQQKIEEKEEKKQKLVFPIVLMTMGIFLMALGFFFEPIVNFLGIDWFNQKEEKKIKNEEKDNNIYLKCTKELEDESTGVKTTTEYEYTFNVNNQLQSLSETRKLTVIENSDIGYDNIKVIYKSYDELAQQFENVNGISLIPKLRENDLVVSISYDYSNIDETQVPKNNYISIINTKNQTLKSVKKDMATVYNFMCK